MQTRYIYDIEVYQNLFCVTFMNLETKEKYLFAKFGKRDDSEQLKSFLNREIVLVGYNNLFYDNPVMQYFLQNANQKSVLQDTYEFSSMIVGSDRNFSSSNQIRKYQYTETKYTQIDMMKIVEISGVAPSLKQAGINLKYHRVQDLPLPFDHIVQNEEEAQIIYEYNLNDVYVSEKLYYHIISRIELREKLNEIFHVDLMNASDSKMADRLLEKFYVEELHADMSIVRNLRTKREQFMLRECIAPNIKFQTNYLNRIKNEIANTIVRKTNRHKYSKHIAFGGVEYDLGVGGLHSVDPAGVFISNEEWKIYDQDVSSYYPSMMIVNKIVPSHLDNDFTKVLSRITNERIYSKREYQKLKKMGKENSEEYKYHYTKAEGLKVTINSIFGKLGTDTFWLEDAIALRSVTVSGQLYLLMLIEKLVLSGIQVISANTDGVVSRIHVSQLEKFEELGKEWQEETGFVLDKTEYSKYFRNDVNNYITIKSDGEVKEKGRFTRKSDIKKGYRHPIVPIAMYEYVVNDIPVEETIRNHKDILDFCISEKSGKEFQMEYHVNDQVELLQKNNRFYVSNTGGAIIKRRKTDNTTIGLMVGENVKLLNDYDESLSISDYDIKYEWYINEAKKYTEDVKEFSDTFQPFIDEPPDFQIPQDTLRREEFFLKFQNIKNLPEKVIDNLLWLEDNFKGESFFDFMVFAEDNSKVSSKFETFIKLGIFDKFGERLELLEFFELFVNGKNKYSNKLSDKSKNTRLPILKDEWIWRKSKPSKLYEQIKMETSVSDVPFNLHPTLHKQYVYVKDIDLKSYHPKIKLHILKTGEEKVLKVKQDTYYDHHFKTGEILLAKTFEKKFRKTRGDDGKWVETENFDWFMTSWYKMKPHDKFIEE